MLACSAALLVQPGVLGCPVNTDSQRADCHVLKDPRVWRREEGAGAGKVQGSHTFPGFGSIISLEIRIKAILTILELKTPPKAQ